MEIVLLKNSSRRLKDQHIFSGSAECHMKLSINTVGEQCNFVLKYINKWNVKSEITLKTLNSHNRRLLSSKISDRIT